MNTIKIISTICLGIMLGLFVPDKEKNQLKAQQQESKIQLEEARLLIEKFQEHNEKAGGFVLLNKDVGSITFKNFEGEITWYQSWDLEKIKSDYSNVDFHPIKREMIHADKIIQVPHHACAFLRKGKIKDTRENYSIVYTTK
jgi:hypothetical protein